MAWRGRYERPEDVIAADKVAAQFRPVEPTRDEIMAMSIEALRDLFDRNGFPITVSWEDLLRIREGK